MAKLSRIVLVAGTIAALFNLGNGVITIKKREKESSPFSKKGDISSDTQKVASKVERGVFREFVERRRRLKQSKLG